MPAIETRQLSQQVYGVLLGRIVSGTLAPGEKLVDLKLAEELQVSRTPVKEALARLAAEGLVEIAPRKGTFVSRIEPRHLDEAFDIRQIMEVYAAERAADLMTEEELGDLRQLVEKWRLMLDDPDTFSEERFKVINAEFHWVLVRSCRNYKLIELYGKLDVFLQIARVRYRRSLAERERSLEEHTSLLQALERRNGAEAGQILACHLQRSKEELLESVRWEQKQGHSWAGSPEADTDRAGLSNSPGSEWDLRDP